MKESIIKIISIFVIIIGIYSLKCFDLNDNILVAFNDEQLKTKYANEYDSSIILIDIKNTNSLDTFKVLISFLESCSPNEIYLIKNIEYPYNCKFDSIAKGSHINVPLICDVKENKMLGNDQFAFKSNLYVDYYSNKNFNEYLFSHRFKDKFNLMGLESSILRNISNKTKFFKKPLYVDDFIIKYKNISNSFTVFSCEDILNIDKLSKPDKDTLINLFKGKILILDQYYQYDKYNDLDIVDNSLIDELIIPQPSIIAINVAKNIINNEFVYYLKSITVVVCFFIILSFVLLNNCFFVNNLFVKYVINKIIQILIFILFCLIIYYLLRIDIMLDVNLLLITILIVADLNILIGLFIPLAWRSQRLPPQSAENP